MKNLAETLLYINFAWYVALTLAFGLASVYPKALYFLGAAILTMGVVLM